MPGIGDEIARRVDAAASSYLELVGLDLLGRAQRDAPVEEGTLRGSGSSRVVRTADGAVVIVSFATPYAARQHEEVTWKHPKGGRSKYLEANLKLMLPTYRSGLASAVSGALRGL